MRLSDENLRGRTIIAADGQVVGEVAAVFIESDTWRVESLHVKLGKAIADQLGANRSVFRAGALEIPVRMAQSVGDTVVLSVPVEGLREVLPSARSEAEEAPANKRANKQAIEKAKLADRAKAVDKARLEKKAKVVEKAEAVKKARLEKKAKVVEKARLEKKAKVVEKARLEKKAKVVEKARLKKAKVVEKARLEKRAKGAKEAAKAAVM